MKKKHILKAAVCFAMFCASMNLWANAENVSAGQSLGILKEAEDAGIEGVLSYIPNERIEENLMQNLLISEDKLLTFYAVYDAQNDTDALHLRLFSLDSGELLAENALLLENAYTAAVQMYGKQVVVSDAQSGSIHVYDEKLEEICQYEAFGESIYVNPSVTEAYCFDRSEGLWRLTLENGEKQELLGEVRELGVSSYSENNVSMRYVDLSTQNKMECYAGLNLETGELEKLAVDESFFTMEYHAGVWAGEFMTESGVYFLGTQQEPFRFETALSYPITKLAGNAPQLLFMATDMEGGQSMMAYGMDGTYLSGFSMNGTGASLTMNQAWSDEAEGYFLIAIDETGHDRLYFWDMTKEMEGEPLILQDAFVETEMSGTVLEQAYYDRAGELSKKYGMTIKIAEQCAVEYSDKYAEQECDAEKVSAALDVLEQALSNYPEGFFKQLRYGEYRKLEINLMGAISNKEYIEGYAPSAFAQQENGKNTIVFNIDESIECLEGNVYHEFSHVIDKVLAHDALYREDALYSEETWWSMNPAEFINLNPEYGGYYESYEMMPMDYYQEDFTSYFVIDYGKTFSTEDRATIMEAAMSGNYRSFSKEVSEALYAKLEYYSQCIRDCFDTTGWPDVTKWEQALK